MSPMSPRLMRPRANYAVRYPGAPTSLMAAAGNALVVLSWTAPAYNGGSAITDYAVQFSSNSGATWTTFADGTSTATTATVTGLTNGTTYVFRVAAVNSVGTGPYATTSGSATPITPPTSLWKADTLQPSYHWSI